MHMANNLLLTKLKLHRQLQVIGLKYFNKDIKKVSLPSEVVHMKLQTTHYHPSLTDYMGKKQTSILMIIFFFWRKNEIY